MSTFIIEGGHPLCGSVVPSGNKNAALPILAATLLTDEPVTLHNVPRIGDVVTMLQLLADLGGEVGEWDGISLTLRAREVRKATLDSRLCKGIRASVLLAGPVLARRGELHLPLPYPPTDVVKYIPVEGPLPYHKRWREKLGGERPQNVVFIAR